MDIKSYEIKSSKIGNKVPVVNGIHLHSMYNPVKEAESIVDRYDEMIKDRRHILVLGLGFAYHVHEIVIRMKKIHGSNFQVMVVDPNADVANDCQKIYPLIDNNVRIFCSEQVGKIYSDSWTVQFLKDRPGVITHPSSFNLYSEYFKEFMSYAADTSLESIIGNICDEDLSTFLNKFNSQLSFDQCLNEIKERAKKGIENKSRFNHFFTALSEIIVEGEIT